ncbi:MAG: Ldh family oxidoreductase [Caldilineaceae bacterium]
MATTDVRASAQALQAFTTEVFTQAGLSPADAAIEAEVLVWANLRGIDSHGVLRIPWYLSLVDKER